MDLPPMLEMNNITKLFPGVRALSKVSIKMISGEVRALVGENGAGKSTLIKILSGVYQPSEGEIFINGKKENITNPEVALKLGIVPVHQEINLEPFLSVAENIFLGRQPQGKFGLVDYKKMNQDAQHWLSEMDVSIDPSLPLGMLSIAEKQMVAIARAISLDAKILIFDEPTSSLTQKETRTLFEVIRRLKEKNICIIYISHRMEEIFEICTHVTIMRDGSVVSNNLISEVNTDSIIRMMIGRDVQDMFKKTKSRIGNPVLELKNLSVKGILKDISLTLNKGEIVGISGLVGAGRTELARAIFGDLSYDSGQMLINGKVVRLKSPKDAIQAGIGLVPEDRKEQGLVLGLSVTENISITIFSFLTKFGIINRAKEAAVATQYVDQLAIKTPSIKQRVKFLSGGNQQRVVVAKWLATNPKLLIVDEPTRGIDVGAKAEIHTLLNNLAGQGVAILMISSELPEILAMSDRILVMYQGRIKAELSGENITEEEIMRYATGQA